MFDADRAAAAATRRMMLDRASADRLLVGGMHTDFPGFGHVERDADAYRYLLAPMLPAV